jgi:ribosome biogenesis GTPase A
MDLFGYPSPTSYPILAPPRFESATEFLTLVALKRGKLGKGGAPDHDAAARAVLQEWNAGTIAYHTEPPKKTVEVRRERTGAGWSWRVGRG